MQEVYLVHHGVKGMKWGVRHDRKPSGNQNKKSKIDKQKVKRGIKTAAAIAVTAAIAYNDIKKIGEAYSDSVLKKNSGVKTSELYNFRTRQMDTTNKYGIYDKEHMGAGFGMTGRSFDDIDYNMVSSINPTKSNQNCFHCSLAYIMDSVFDRKVQALDYNSANPFSSDKGTTWTALDLMFDNVKTKDYTIDAHSINDFPDLFDATRSMPNSSTGIMLVQNDRGRGHYINYEKDSNGNTTIVDGQNGIKSDPETYGYNTRFNRVEKSFDFTNASVIDDADWIMDGFIKKRR